MRDIVTSGIYVIKNLQSGKVYVGSAVDLELRWRNHKSKLSRGVHENQYLQRSWDKNGWGCFEFGILEQVQEVTALIDREQYWLDHTRCYDRSIGYNICRVAGNRLGVTHSNETRDKISSARIGKYTDEKNGNARLNWEDIKRIRADWASGEYLQKQLAEQYGVSRTHINRIVNNKFWFDPHYRADPEIPKRHQSKNMLSHSRTITYDEES